MADSGLDLLFRLKASNQATPAIKSVQADVAKLRQTFGSDFNQMKAVSTTAISSITSSLSGLTGSVPVLGGALARVTETLNSFGKEGAKVQQATAGVAQSIQSIATQSGKSVPQVAAFLTKFVQLEGQAKRNDAAFKFFGGSVDLIGNKTAKFIPELEAAGSALRSVSSQSATAGASIAAMAGPIGIAAVVLAAMAGAAVLAAKEIFELAKRSADAQGKMFDLAQQTGLAVETLSTLEVVAKTTGGELGSITQAVVLFQRKLDDAQDPLSKTAELFRKFSIETTDTENALRSTFAALAQMPEGFAQTNAAAEFFGARGGKQVLAILKETNGDLDATTQRLRDLGILITADTARAADKFNDELAILDFQIRALGAALVKDLIPMLIDTVRQFGELVAAIRPLLSLLGTIAGPLVRNVTEAFKAISIAVKILTLDYEGLKKAIKEAREEKEKDIPALNVPAPTPVPLPGVPTGQQTTSDAVNQANVVVAAVKRQVAEHAAALATLAQQGRVTREREASETIAGNKKILDADKQRIDALLKQKEEEIKALDEAQKNRGEVVRRDTDAYRSVTAEIGKLQQERLDKESEFEVESRAIRNKAAKERADSKRNDIRNESDLLANEFDRQIKEIEAQIKRGATVEATGLTIIEQLEQAKIDTRIEFLQKQKDVGFLTIQDLADLNNELQKLNQERDRLADEQGARRLERERNLSQQIAAITIGSIETLLQLQQIAGERLIATTQAQADRRVITEEAAARKILQIRLDLIDAEIEATNKQLTAAGTIADKSERTAAEADLNNQIQIRTEQRKTILSDGNRAIDDARQADLDSARQYADDLQEIQDRITDIERDTAEEVIRLLILDGATRRAIIRARRDLELSDEAERHRRVTADIQRQKRDVDSQIRILEGHIKALKIGTQAEIDEHDRLIKKLEELKQKRDELKRQQDAEDAKNKTRERRTKKESEKEEEELDPLEKFKIAKEDIKKIAEEMEASIVPLTEILTGAFLQVADAIGQTVANWVLLGETGPAVMRRILAQALASIAAEAAVNAIKELALGFAMLFVNPAAAGAHFTAAALWGSIAGVAAIAGRAVAGDLFKPKDRDSSSSKGSSDALQTIVQGRNQPQPVNITINMKGDDSKLASFITASVVRNIGDGGEIREVIQTDSRG